MKIIIDKKIKYLTILARKEGKSKKKEKKEVKESQTISAGQKFDIIIRYTRWVLPNTKDKKHIKIKLLDR